MTTQVIDTVIFDVGGVLIDWNPEYLYRKLIPDAQARAHFLENICTREWNMRQDEGRRWEDAVAERIALFPDHADLIRAFDARWPEMVSGPVKDVPAIKGQLRAAGIPVYAITNFSDEKWDVAQKHFPYLADFDGIIVSGREKMAKPDPAIFRLLCDRYTLNPQTCLFIDDLPVNVEGAKGVGMHGHVFTSAVHLRETLENALNVKLA